MSIVKGLSTGAVVIAIPLLALLGQCCAGTIEVSLPDTCAAPGDTIWLPIFTTDVTDSGVYGYNLTVHFDTAFAEVDTITSDGTISEPWGGGNLVWNVAEGDDSLRIAAAGIQPLTGEGMLVRIGFRIRATSPTDSSTMLSMPEAVLRDMPGKPPTITHPGWLTVPCTAGIGVPEAEEKPLEINWLDPASIRWHLDAGTEAAGHLKIYDPMGRLVAEVGPTASSTSATYVWHGETEDGGKAAAGVYFFHVKAGRRFWGGKVGILR